MFDFLFKRKKVLSLTNLDKQKYLEILKEIFQVLENNKLHGQSQAIEKIINLLEKDDLIRFEKLVNGVDMWGGAGAVWEVYIENEKDASKFEKKMIDLIDLMEQTNILGNGIKPIRRIFQKNKNN